MFSSYYGCIWKCVTSTKVYCGVSSLMCWKRKWLHSPPATSPLSSTWCQMATAATGLMYEQKQKHLQASWPRTALLQPCHGHNWLCHRPPKIVWKSFAGAQMAASLYQTTQTLWDIPFITTFVPDNSNAMRHSFYNHVCTRQLKRYETFLL